jgi:hypothetical protein
VTTNRASHLRAQAAWCRTLADGISDLPAHDILMQAAADFDSEAKQVDDNDAAMALAVSHGPIPNG